MPHRDALAELIAACLAAPEDDAPRLVWADAVGGPRGELVVVQCDLSLDSDELPASAIALRRGRERELLREHGAAWSGLAGLATRCWYRRGFVDRVEVHVDRLFDRADRILESAPFLRTLAIVLAESRA